MTKYSPFSLLAVAMLTGVMASVLAADDAKPAHTNRLAKEKSPYLLQHAHNPVDWYPWGDEAFEKAKKENKPVLLSIGYSTCHWCHVMERESFENEETAKYLNGHFVAIKLDREERPDLDSIYMTAMQGLGLGGGWPLNVFMTPDRKPFYGGTYFPPKARDGQPGFVDVLKRVDSLWTTKEAEVRENAGQLAVELGKALTQRVEEASKFPLKKELLDLGAKEFLTQYDAANGGFGKAPKFPQPQVLALVLRHGSASGDAKAVEAVAHTCDRMAAGGIYDQLGGGFARYSTDAKWLVPHFEKMLYDNAQLANVYLDVALVTGRERFNDVARGLFRYVLRDLTAPDGGFYSAEDADSEGHEGKFYCWTKAELTKALTADELKFAETLWGVTEGGNFLDHSRPDPLPMQNILSLVDPKRQLSADEKRVLETVGKKLIDVRSKRVRPLRDDKILASWNGLMLSALARGGIILGDDALLAAAKKNAVFLRTKMWDEKSKSLAHRWRDGETDKAQLLRSYAFVLQGVLDLYQATLDPAQLDFARALADSMVAKFYDPESGGFFQSAASGDLILRTKEDYDDAEPSGNSVAILALLQLSALTEAVEAPSRPLREMAAKSLRLFAGKLTESATSVPLMLQAVANFAEAPYRVVIAGDPASAGARALVKAANSIHQPNKVVLGTVGCVEEFAKTLVPMDGAATAYVCTGSLCRPPTGDPSKVRESLRAGPPAGKPDRR